MRKSLYESYEDFAYYVNVNNLNDVYDEGELIDILFDEYALDCEFYDKDIVKVYAPNNNTIQKLEDCLQKYGASNDYIYDVINKVEIYENKNYNKNMRRSFNDRLMHRRLNESIDLRNRRSFKADRILETYKVNMFGDFDPIFEAEDDKKCTCRYKGKLISKMDKAAKRTAKEEVRVEISDLKKQIKDVKKAGKSTKALEAKLERLQHVLDCLMGKCENVNESSTVQSTFSRRRRLFEAEEDADDNEDVEDDVPADDEGEQDVEDQTNDSADDKDEYEDVEMKAVVLTVLKKNIDTVKDAMVNAGVSEDDINVDEMDDDTSDDDQVDIRVDVNSIDALTKYLESVGINLEDELGGEVVANDDASDDDAVDGDDDSDAEGEGDDDFDPAEFDDLFKDEA